MNYYDFHHHKKNCKSGIYNLNLFEEIPDLNFSVGIHPKQITNTITKDFEWLQKISLYQKCFAIGECGLDSLIDVDEKLQEEVFLKHILWANEINKPVIIHCVRRFSELLKFKKIARTPMIIHGFNKKKTIADELLQHGFYLSFGNALLYNISLQNILKEIPLEKIFLETDASEFNIEALYCKLAEIKNTSVNSIENKILENLDQIFNGQKLA